MEPDDTEPIHRVYAARRRAQRLVERVRTEEHDRAELAVFHIDGGRIADASFSPEDPDGLRAFFE